MLYLSPVYRSETLTYTVQPEVKEDATLSASAARRPLPPSTTIGQGAKKLICTTNFLLTSNHILISTLKTRTDKSPGEDAMPISLRRSSQILPKGQNMDADTRL
jgi:hypothetical protein